MPFGAAPGVAIKDDGTPVLSPAAAINCGSGLSATNDGGGQVTLTASGGTATPGGTNGQIQFNDGGALGGLDSTGTGNVVRAASPALSGTPTTPTAAANTNTTQIASTAFVQQELASRSYLDGEVEVHADLPVTIGTPPVDSAYLVRESSGVWLINRKPAGIWVRLTNGGTLADWVYAGTFADVYSDANFALYDDGDSTKELGWSLGGLTTGAKRVWTAQDKNGTVSLDSDVTDATGKTTPADDDLIGLRDSAASNALKKLTWANLKATLKTYLDTLYQAAGSYAAASHTHAQSDITDLTTDLAGKLGTGGTAADVNPAGTAIAAALAGKAASSHSHIIADTTGLQTALDAKEPTQTAASQVEAEAGTSTAIRSFTPQRIAQAIAALAPGGGGSSSDVQIFTANGTWTKPSGTPKSVQVIVWGGGGGGGGGRGSASGAAQGGGGGGGGARNSAIFAAGDLPATVTVTVGAGGTSGSGGSTANGSAGGAGGTSSFGNFVSAYGGGGGKGGTSGEATVGGGGGGTGGAGTTGSGGNFVAGGDPGNSSSIQWAIGGGGSRGNGGGNGQSSAEYGGAGGAGSDGAGTQGVGGCSLFGGAGGGCGGAVTAGGSRVTGTQGGASGTYNRSGGGGGAGGAGTDGAAGTAGDAYTTANRPSGSGGGGGSGHPSGTGGSGGAGGLPGGGGGGGAGGISTGGAGGVGGAGQVIVITTY